MVENNTTLKGSNVCEVNLRSSSTLSGLRDTHACFPRVAPVAIESLTLTGSIMKYGSLFALSNSDTNDEWSVAIVAT